MPAPNEFNVMPLASVASRTDRVTEVLLQKIRNREYPPNARLPSEGLMAKQFGVSRTVIREAISRLKSEGLVEARQGSGTFVREAGGDVPFRIDLDVNNTQMSVLRVIELRRALEAEMAALAAERRTPEQMQRIRQALESIDQAVKEGRDGVEEDVAFHTAISDATGNPLFTSLLGFLNQFYHEAMQVTRANEARREDFKNQVLNEHRELVDAIGQQDVQGARAAALRHMENAARRIQAAGQSH